MPKDSKKKGSRKARNKAAQADGSAGWTGDALADRVGRLRGTIEDLSSRLALAEQRLRAAVEATEPAEGRMARFVSLASKAGARLEKELGEAVVALLEPTDAPDAEARAGAATPAPRRRRADASSAPPPRSSGRRAAGASSRAASTPKTATRKTATRKASTPKAATRKASTPKAATRKASTPKAATRKASTRKATTRKGSTPRPTGTARGR